MPGKYRMTKPKKREKIKTEEEMTYSQIKSQNIHITNFSNQRENFTRESYLSYSKETVREK